MQTRLVSYPIYGSTRKVLPDALSHTITTPLGELPTGNIHYPRAGTNADAIASETEVAFEYWNGTAWVEPPNARFFPMGGSFNHIEDIPTQQFKLLGFGWLLRNAKVWEAGTLPIDADGKVQFLSANAGTIMHTLITKAKARGWGSGVTIDFTATTDSSGAAWASVITLAYDLELSLEAVLNNLFQQGMCDYRWEGRTLRLFNPDTTMAREKPSTRLTVADGQTSAPEEWTDEDRLTDTLVLGDKGNRWTFNNGATGGFGRLERVTTQSGVTDSGTAALLASRDLIAGLSTRASYTREFDLTRTATNEPFAQYLPGDWISAQRGTTFERMRVVSVSVTTKPEGVTGHAVLGDRIEDILAKLAKRTSGITGGATAGGSGGRPAPDGPDTRTPSAPTGLVVGSIPYTNENGFPQGLMSADWAHSGDATNGTAQTPDRYQLQRRINLTGEKWKMVAETTDTEVAYSPVDIYKADGVTPEQYAHRVRAVSEAGIVSEWSTQAITTMETDTTPPAAPFFVQANVTTWLRTVKVTWDGTLTTTGTNHIALPKDFQRVDVYQDTQASMATQVKIGEMYGPLDFVVVPAATAGVALYYRLVAIDRTGNASTPSAIKSITPQANVNAAEIINAINAAEVTLTNVGEAALVDQAVTTIKLKDNAIVQGKLAQTIQDDIAKGTSAYGSLPGINSNISALTSSVSGKNSIFNSTATPSNTTNPGTAVGDRWQKWTTLAAGGKITNTYRWNSGNTWVEEALAASYIPLIDIGQGTFGTLAGGRIEANSVKTESLISSDMVNFAPSLAEVPLGNTYNAGDWTILGGAEVVASTLDDTGKRFHVADNTGATGWMRGPYLAVREGQTLHGYTKTYRGTGTQAMYLRYYWYDANKVELASPNNYTQIGVNSVSATGYTIQGAVTVPAGAAFARYVLAAGTGTGTVGFYKMDGFRQSSTVMIGQGAVTANEVNATSVAAGIGSFLTINVSQLNATTASIGSGVIDKLWSDVVMSRKIGTEQLTVTGENLIPDPFFFDDVENTYRLATGGPHYLATDSASTAKIIQFRNHTAAGGNVRLHRIESRIKVMPGEEYSLLLDYRYRGTTVAGATPGTIKFALFCDAPDGTYLRTVNLTASTRSGANGTSWLSLEDKYVIPSDVGYIRVSAQITNEISTGDVELRFPKVKRKVSAGLIVDDGIITRHLNVTDDMVVKLLNVHKIKAVDIDANDIIADTATIGTLRGGILINDAVTTGMLKADAINAKHTLTGAKIQTVATSLRGIKLEGDYFRAYHPTSGAEVFTISGATGNVIGTGKWRTGSAGNFIEMEGDANGGILRFWTGNASGRGSLWARDDPTDGEKMSMAYSSLDPDSGGTLPVVVVTPTKAYLRYASKAIQTWNNAGSEELLLDATGTSMVFRGGVDMRTGGSRTQYRYQTTAQLGYVGQRPESGTSADFEFRADAGGVRLTGSSLTAFTVYNNTTASAANVNVDSGGVLRRVSSASRYKADQKVMALDDELLQIPIKDWIDKASVKERKAMERKPRPFIETDQQKYDALDLGRIPGVIAEDVEQHKGKPFVIYGPDGRTESVMYDRLAVAQIAVLKRQLDAAIARITALEKTA